MVSAENTDSQAAHSCKPLPSALAISLANRADTDASAALAMRCAFFNMLKV